MHWQDWIEKMLFGFTFGVGFYLAQWLLGKILK